MHPPTRIGRLALVLFAGSSSLAVAQTVYVVDGAAGPGFTHTTIGAAVAAAVDGDFVLVRTGIYPETLLLNAKGIAKLLLGIAKGKKMQDKRETERKRDGARQNARLMRERG